jgi:AraC-like DNA-binding protein
MDFLDHNLSAVARETPRPEGLYRTTIAGPGRSLEDAFDRLEAAADFPRVLRNAQQDMLSARVALRPEEGEGYWELTRVRNDLYIILSNFKYHEARHEIVPGDGLVQFNFKVSGDLTYEVSLPGPLRFNRPGLHLWRQPRGIDMREWTAPRSHQRTVTVCVRPQFLVDRFLMGRGQAPPQLQAFLVEPGATIDFFELPMTSPMLEAIARLLGNPYSDSLYLAYQQALVQELLCAAVAHCLSPAAAHPTDAEEQLQAVTRARRLLNDQLSSPPTIADVARAVGLPQKRLTEVFRSVYGETLFDFSVRCRMEQALILLRDQHRSVDDVSHAVGYAHPTSFATAFRRHFGVRPIDIKPKKATGFRHSRIHVRNS